MKPKYHVAVSAGLAIGLQLVGHSWPASLGCFLSGVLIDLDHYVDYCYIKKEFPYQFKDLAAFSEDLSESKVYILFHGYEYLFVLWLSIYYLHLNLVWIGVAIGLTTHLIFDQFTNPVKPLFYFVTFRSMNKFEKTKVLSERYFNRKKLIN